MNLDTRSSRAACLLVVLGITSYATAAESLLVAVVAVPVVLAAWRLTGGPGPRVSLPRWAVNLLVVGALMLSAYRAARGGLDVTGVAELVVLLQLIKLGDRRTARDDAQILSLAVFLAIAAMLTSNEFWVGVQLIVFLPVLVTAVMLFQLRSGQEAFARAVRAAVGPQGMPPPIVTGRRAAPGLRGAAALSLMGALAVSVFVFVFMPRGIGERFFGQWGTGPSRQVTGFTDQVRLGAGGVISESHEVVMDVRVTTPAGASLGGPDEFQYLRGSVLDRYENGVWTAREVRPAADIGAGQRITFGGDDVGTADVVQQVRLRRPDPRGQAVFMLWRPVRAEFRTEGRVARDERSRVLRVFATARSPGPPGEYTVWSRAVEPADALSRRRPGVGFPSQTIARRAAEIAQAAGLDPDPETRPVGDDPALLRAVESHLRSNYQYTLEEEAAPASADPIEHFLFTTRRGHCEYFASAMTALCRALGINARIAVGYLAAEYNPASDAYTVRASNAHAWVEAELGNNRWRRFDPTPAADLVRIHRPPVGLLGRARQWIDALEFLWNTRVVSFDERARTRLLRADGSGEPGLLARFDRLLERVRAGGPRLVADAVGVGGAVFILIAGVGSVVVAVLSRRGGARPGARGRRRGGARGLVDPSLAARLARAGFYDRLLVVLSRRGRPKPIWRPPRDHARAIEPADAALARVIDAIALVYYRVRFGGATLSDAEQRDAESAVERLSAGGRG